LFIKEEFVILVLTRSGRSTRREFGTKSDFAQTTDPLSTVVGQQQVSSEDSDSDAPEEISSKPGPDIKLLTDSGENLSLFEEVPLSSLFAIPHQGKVGYSDESSCYIYFKSKVFKNLLLCFLNRKAEFKVLTLDEGINKSLEPRVNFRDELLRARTAGKRERGWLLAVSY
uniref:GRAM domain-containing protein n=1 Tax=Angiostrongylus cantonensis TaxID=6313 RepID=A0A0K0CXV5_ANGCA